MGDVCEFRAITEPCTGLVTGGRLSHHTACLEDVMEGHTLKHSGMCVFKSRCVTAAGYIMEKSSGSDTPTEDVWGC